MVQSVMEWPMRFQLFQGRSISAVPKAADEWWYLTESFYQGPIVLKSNVNLHVSEGAEILFSTDEKDYLPPVLTRWEGTEVFNFSPLIYAYNVKNIASPERESWTGRVRKYCNMEPRQKPDQQALRKMGTEVRPLYERVFGEGHILRPAFIEPFMHQCIDWRC